MNNKALIAMSGGVDSSVAAKIMVDRGYECIGCTMKLYDNEDVGLKKGNTCCSFEDTFDARNVAYKLGMQYYVLNFADEFYDKVIKRFIDNYENGRTPNPCIDCNKYMKFDKLFDTAKSLGFDYIVTGHYARIEFDGERYLLKKAIDDTKDQSYVLYTMTQYQLAHTVFPLGDIPKIETRRIAEENGFINADKPDSQDICFVPNGDYAAVIEHYTDKKYRSGNFVDKFGNVLGEHNGIIRYTVGQRRNLGISLGKPIYVCGIDCKNNTVILGDEKDLYNCEMTVTDFNWISGEVPKEPVRCKVKIRYKKPEEWATVLPVDDKTLKVIFDAPQRAITAGQSAVMYDGDIVLGGGIIINE